MSRCRMVKKMQRRPRRDESLSREQIIEAAIELLDSGGEPGLTFRNLSERLATGPGAIYGHVANKNDLLEAACSAVIGPGVNSQAKDMPPKAAIRALALMMFDAMDAPERRGFVPSPRTSSPQTRESQQPGRPKWCRGFSLVASPVLTAGNRLYSSRDGK